MHIQLLPWHSTENMFANVSFVVRVGINKMEKLRLLVAEKSNISFEGFSTLSRWLKTNKTQRFFSITQVGNLTLRQLQKTQTLPQIRAGDTIWESGSHRKRSPPPGDCPPQPNEQLLRGHKIHQIKVHFREYSLFLPRSFWPYLLHDSLAAPITNPP